MHLVQARVDMEAMATAISQHPDQNPAVRLAMDS